MRAAIFGAGAMGTVLGALITKNGGEVELITRNRAHVEALNKDGAKICGGLNFTVKVTAYTPEEMRGEYDLIFLMTKQRENEKVLSNLKKYLTADGVVCTMQNGLPEDSVADAVGRERTLGCAVSWGAGVVCAGCARLTTKAKKMTFALGSPYGENKKTEEVKNLLSLAGKVAVEENFSGARWAKLAMNCAFSPLSAVTGKTFGQVARDKKCRAAALEILNEVFSAANSAGVTLAKIQGHDVVKLFAYGGAFKRALAYKILPLAMRSHKNSVSGMYYDLSAGKPCEVDFICGAALEAADKNGACAPVLSRAVELIHKIERGDAVICPENANSLI